MPKVPVPNQPSFVFNYHLFTINMSGSVTNHKHKVGTMYVHGNTIRGTQTVVGIPVVWTGFTHKGRIFMHGYFLTAYAPFATTRFRIPLIVSIWKLYLGHCNVIATATETQQDTVVYATTDIETEYIKPTWVMIDSGADAMETMYGHFEMHRISETRHLITPIIRVINVISKVYTRVRNKWKNLRSYISSHVATPTQYKNSKVRVRVPTVEQVGHFSLIARTITPIYEKAAKFTVELLSPTIVKTYKLSVHLVNSTIQRTIKLSVTLFNPILKGVHKLTTSLQSGINHTHKVKVDVGNPIIHTRHKLSIHVIHPVIESLHKLKVYAGACSIEKVLGFIQWLLSGHKIEQHSKFDFKSQQVVRQAGLRISGAQIIKGWLRAWINLQSIRVLKLLNIRAHNGVSEKALLKIHSAESIYRFDSTVTVYVEYMKRMQRLLFNYTIKTEEIDLNIDVIPGLAERFVRFQPVNVPQVKWLNIMITVLHSETLSYLNFIADEVVRDKELYISVHWPETVSLLQWYLHGGSVSNDGYGNEVIFDLGEADDGSSGEHTIPPIPSRQWSGGYVEDPFKGLGYKPTEESTGYNSPSVESWLSGSKMYWANPTKPFREE